MVANDLVLVRRYASPDNSLKLCAVISVPDGQHVVLQDLGVPGTSISTDLQSNVIVTINHD